ncbi:MAG: PPC domain-containing DNA-binding protein [Halorhabdus sp.]
MDYRELTGSREFVARMTHGADWRGQIEEFARSERIEAAVFFGLGTVQDATIWYYDQDDGEYRETVFDEPLEVAACVGNISLDVDGDPFAHTHVVLSREDGTAIAGHLDAGETFIGELYVRTFEESLEREPDETTGGDLWAL